MKVAVESDGTIEGTGVDREELEVLFDRLAQALIEGSEFEADVAVNLETGYVEFFVVVEAATANDAVARAEALISEAMSAVGIVALGADVHFRRAELVAG